MTATFEPGQSVVAVFRSHRRGEAPRVTETKVKSVGRKWVHLEIPYRFEPETMEIDGEGYSSPGSVFLTLADYELSVTRAAVWGEIRDRVRNAYSVPDAVPLDRMRQFLAWLRETDEP